MSSSDLALSARGLAKAFTIRHQDEHHITLTEHALHRIRHPFSRQKRETFWALNDVSFELRRGEVLGLIGSNGAGKSTLLKVLSRITPPTKGVVELHGRVGSLLEVGTGFHPELTGRENVYLNGAILGMRTSEIDRRFDEIVDFAGVERFLDTPVKRFSSGMFVRLAFAVAAHLDTEILLLDEVLAVGDATFQAKCFGKVEELSTAGRSVILVSHNMTNMQAFATRAILLSGGRLEAEGPVREVVDQYGRRRVDRVAEVGQVPRPPAFGRRVRILRVELDDEEGVLDADAPLRFTVRLHAVETIEALRVAVIVRTAGGQRLATSFGAESIDVVAGGEYSIQLQLPDHHLAPGQYFLGMSIGHGLFSGQELDAIPETVHFQVRPPRDSRGLVVNWDSDFLGNIRLNPLRVINMGKVEMEQLS